MKKHWWRKTTKAEQRRRGIKGECIDCGEIRQESLRGGTCSGRPKSTRASGPFIYGWESY